MMDISNTLSENISSFSDFLSTPKTTTSTQTGEVTVFFTGGEKYPQRINLLAENLNDLLTQAQARAKDVGFDIPSGKYLEVIAMDGHSPEELWTKIQEEQSVWVGIY